MKDFRTKASKNKQRLEVLCKEFNYNFNGILKGNRLTKRTIYIQKKKCGNPNCRCSCGELHRSKLLSLSQQGKTRLIPLTRFSIIEQIAIERQVKNYQKFRLNRAKLVHFYKELIAETNKLEQVLLMEVKPKKRRMKHDKKGSKSGSKEGSR